MKNIEDKIGKIGTEHITTDDVMISTNFGVKQLDSLSRLSILLVLAGYKQEEHITVVGENLSRHIDIDRFGNLNLNFKKAAPMMFHLNVEFEPDEKESPRPSVTGATERKKTIVLASGGIDSIAGMLYCEEKGRDYIPFWLSFGQQNQASEEQSLYRISKKLGVSPLRSHVDLESFVNGGRSTWKLGIVPARNLLILALAGLYIRTLEETDIDVFLCASKDEIVESHNDTSPEFYRDASILMSGYLKKNVSVMTPFADINKAGIIKYWSKFWEEVYGVSVSDTMTCFTGDHCGDCSACYYRRVNVLVAGANDVEFKNDPMADKGGLVRDYYIPSFPKWSETRQVDFLIALTAKVDIIPVYAHEFLLANIPRYKRQIKQRLAALEKIEIR